MSEAITFYTNPMSRGRIVRWMLEEVGEPYETVVLDYGTTMKAPEYLAVNPMGKVPAIRHGGTVVTEAAAICAYLADMFPDRGLAPSPGNQRRGPYYRWLFFGAGPIEQVISNTALGLQIPPDKEPMMGYGTADKALGVLERAVSETPYLCGEQFTAADLYIASQLGFGMMFGIIEKRAAFEAYVGRLQARPAAQRAREIDDALMPNKEEQPA